MIFKSIDGHAIQKLWVSEKLYASLRVEVRKKEGLCIFLRTLVVEVLNVLSQLGRRVRKRHPKPQLMISGLLSITLGKTSTSN